MNRTRIIVPLVAVALAAALPTAGSASTEGGNAGLQAVRQFTDQYRLEATAVADGFHRTDECVPEMGYHYVHFGRIDERLEPSRPEIVIYAPTTDGRRRLAAAEWLVVDRDQDVTTDDDRPSLFGHPFDGPMPGHEPGMPIHYDLHAYAWLENPAGGFATWNSAIHCPDASQEEIDNDEG